MKNTLESTTKEYLFNSINEQQNLYSKKLIEYMYSLINLESSILKRDTFTDEELKILESIELFRKISNFNTYYKTIDIYKKYAIERRKLDKLKFECSLCEREEKIFLDTGDNYKLLLEFKKLGELNEDSCGYEIDYFRTEDDQDTLFDKFGQYFEECNDISYFDITSEFRSTKTYQYIRSRIVKIPRLERND